MLSLLLYFVVFGIFFVLGIPVALSLAVSSLAILLINGIDIMVFAQKFVVSMDNFGLSSMLFFILAGEIMNGGGMTKRIVSAISKLVKNIPGGLAIITIISCAIFAAINGSAIATAIAIGSIMYPAMIKQNYPPAFSAAVIAAGGIIGPIIPPSIPMIVYGSATGDSVAALFTGGLILGVLMAIGECIVAYLICKKMKYGVNAEQVDFGSTKGIFWAILFPIIIMTSIVGGFMTTTETSALAVVYAWFVGTFIYKEFKIKEFPAMTLRAMKSSALVMAIVGSATAVAWVLTYDRVPQQITESLVSTISSPKVFIIATFAILFIVGMIMDLTPAILILTPIFIAPVIAFKIDPIFFGVFFCATLTAGLITPPVGTLIYLGCSMSKSSFYDMVKELKYFILAVYIALFIAIMFPSIITFIPKTILRLYGA